MPIPGDPRRRTVTLLALGVLLVFAALGALQAFNTTKVGFLNPQTSGETLAFTGLTVLVFLVLLVLLVLLFRNLLKLYAGQTSTALGARLRGRMVLGAALIALTPAALMFLFSYQLMNRSLDRWFSPNISQLRDDSTRVVYDLAQYVAANARVEAESIVGSGVAEMPRDHIAAELARHRITLAGGFTMVFGKDRKMLASFDLPLESTRARVINWMDEDEPSRSNERPLSGPLSTALLSEALRAEDPIIYLKGDDYALGSATTDNGSIVVVALPMPHGLSQTTTRIHAGTAAYRELFRTRNRIRWTFFLVLLIITVFVFFSSVWLALFLSKQITHPVEALAAAMNEIAAGKYDYRVQLQVTGEMGELVRSFNHMAADLDASRQLAESSSAQLTAANQAVEARRRELETLLETIPSGVVTLNGLGIVVQANRAFAALIGREADVALDGARLDDLFPAECLDDLRGMTRRCQRMGAAFAEMEMRSSAGILQLALTAARLEMPQGRPGTVLVVEDTTDLLRAQRQMAWKEVAQRVAHEIKNPLTPIALSAERIGRHLDRNTPDSPAIIRKCSEVILGCVGTLRTLVDQFSALAQFPAMQPRPCNLNRVAEEAMAMFAERIDNITVEWKLDDEMPEVMADPVAIRRALANLIDNAAEAMQGSLLRVLTIESGYNEEAAEISISDTGHGLTDEIRERLFLPFYSTKQRGTGLGLSIAAKIAQEHGGTLSAESNVPKGARFLLRLPLPTSIEVEENGNRQEELS